MRGGLIDPLPSPSLSRLRSCIQTGYSVDVKHVSGGFMGMGRKDVVEGSVKLKGEVVGTLEGSWSKVRRAVVGVVGGRGRGRYSRRPWSPR